MRNIFLLLIFSLIFLLRWTTIKSPLPESWTADSTVRFTAPIIDQIEHSDTKTIVNSGKWKLQIKGYAEIIPGDLVSFVGKVEPKVLGGKVVQIVMKDPTFEVTEHNWCGSALHAECLVVTLGNLRGNWISILEKTLPEPMSSLAAGILLGFKADLPQDFYQDLVDTGTLHIVAASGYNVSIVATVLMRLIGGLVSRGLGIVIGISGILVYVLIAGGSASVLRAAIMGSLTLIAYYFGRPAEARRLLWVTGAIMLIINPLMLLNVGFQLSFSATLGLLYIEPWIRAKVLGSRIKALVELQNILKDYFYPTLAATIATLPVIWWHFGRVSWISPIVNVLVLPLIPLVMLLTGIQIGLGSLSTMIAIWIGWVLYVPLWWIVTSIRWWG